MHNLLAELHETKDERMFDTETIEQYVDLYESNEDKKVWWDDREKQVKAWAKDTAITLKNYWAKPFNRDCMVLLSEFEVEVMIGKFLFAGRIDQLRRYDDKYILVDFKTGLANTNEHLIELNYQLSIYSYALRNKCLIDEVGIYRTYDHLPYKKSGKHGNKGDERGQGLYTTTRTQHDYDAMIQDLGVICRQITGPHFDNKTGKLASGGAFGRTPNIMSCQMCSFRTECLDARRKEILIDEGLVEEAKNALIEAGLED